MPDAKVVKELREKTGAGILDCSKALKASNDNLDEAVKWLRENGIAKATKKSGRVAAEGLTSTKISGKSAVIVEVNSETDFVSKNDDFVKLVDVVSTIGLSDSVKTEKEILTLDHDGQAVEEYIVDVAAKIGEKITLRRAKKITSTDLVVEYIHMGGKISVIIAVENISEELAKQIAMHIAATSPKYISSDQISEEEKTEEQGILRKEALNEGKPESIVDKMVVGRMKKYFEEICLLEQNFVIDTDKKIKDVIGEGKITDFVRYEVGEGLDKNSCNFAEEVAAQLK